MPEVQSNKFLITWIETESITSLTLLKMMLFCTDKLAKAC